MKDATIEISLKEFSHIIETNKIELSNNFIYEGLLQEFAFGAGLRLIYSLLNSNRSIDTITFICKDNEDIKITYSLSEIKEAYEKTKYKIGINKANTPLLKHYFAAHVKSENEVKEEKQENLPWIDEIRDKVNPELINYYLNELKQIKKVYKLDNLDLVIYLYFIMCNTLTYDTSYFANSSSYKEYHENYKNISNISLENHKVICYEFNTIMGLIAENFGFTSSIADLVINSDREETIIPLDPTDYMKNEHYALILNDGKHSIYFDSTRGSLDIDLLNVKTGRTIKGIKSVNHENDNYINYKIEKMYAIFLNKYGMMKSIDYKPALNIERKLTKLPDIQDVEINLEDKIKIFLGVTQNISLEGMDEISYIYVLYKNIFKRDYEKVVFRIIRNEEDKPIVAIIFQKNGKSTTVDERDYYMYESGKGFRKVSSDELLDDFFNKKYVNIDDNYDLSLASKTR